MQLVKRSALTLFLAVLSFTAQAHPHSFIRLQTQLVSENDRFVALKMRWTMDEITSADLLYDAGDAKPGSEIWEKAGGGSDGERARPALLHRSVAQRTKGQV